MSDEGRKLAKRMYRPLARSRELIRTALHDLHATPFQDSVLSTEIYELKGWLESIDREVERMSSRVADIGFSEDWMGKHFEK